MSEATVHSGGIADHVQKNPKRADTLLGPKK